MKRVAIVLAAILATTGTVLGAEISVSGISVGGVNAALLMPAKPR